MPSEEQTYREFVKNTLVDIKEQTAKTNGRVTKLERWQSYVIGFCAALSIIILSIGIPLAAAVISTGKV